MKILYALTLGLLTMNAFGQTKEADLIKPKGIVEVTEAIRVVYNNNVTAINQPVWYLDSIPMGKSQLVFNPDDIKNLAVLKDASEGAGSGEVYITTKKDKSYNFLTLEEIKEKYVKSPQPVAIYMIDGKLIQTDLSTYKVDEKYILSISVLSSDDFSYLKEEQRKLSIINIITRTKENIEKANVIHIRGSNTSLKKH